jgi:hypothetical protein
VSKQNYDVTDKGQKKGSILAGGWDSVYQPGSSLKHAPSVSAHFLDLDSEQDPLAAYEVAAKNHQKRGDPGGVILGGKQYVFNTGKGSQVNYVAEHKASENRVMTTSSREGLSPTSVALGHELGHSVRKRRGADVTGERHFLNLTGVPTELHDLWSLTDEELVNITQVENKLLVEQGLDPRVYHKDYEESVGELIYVRLKRYEQSASPDPTTLREIQQAFQAKDMNEAVRLLHQEGF